MRTIQHAKSGSGSSTPLHTRCKVDEGNQVGLKPSAIADRTHASAGAERELDEFHDSMQDHDLRLRDEVTLTTDMVQTLQRMWRHATKSYEICTGTTSNDGYAYAGIGLRSYLDT